MQKQTSFIGKTSFTANRPTTKILQRCDLLLPELVTVCTTTVKTVKKLRKLVDEEKGKALKRREENFSPLVLQFLTK